MNSDEQYEGWSNRETWAVALHINDDQGWQESVHEALRALMDDEHGPDANYMTREGQAGEIIRENVEEVIHGYSHGDADSYDEMVNVLADIGSLWRVDWTELGASFLESLKEDES